MSERYATFEATEAQQKKARVRMFNVSRVLQAQHSSSRPDVNCVLFHEDQLPSEFKVSTYAHDLISSSLDHLVSLSEIIDNTKKLPMYAGYPMIRAALESSSMAFCMLNTSDPMGRMSYRVQLGFEDLNREFEFVEDLLKHDEASKNNDVEKLKVENRRRYHLLKEQKGALSLPKVTSTDATTLIKKAGVDSGIYGPKSSFMPSYYWRVLSGASHAKEWAFSQTMLIESSAESDGLLHVVRSSNARLLSDSLLYTTFLTRMAFEKYRVLTGQTFPTDAQLTKLIRS